MLITPVLDIKSQASLLLPGKYMGHLCTIYTYSYFYNFQSTKGFMLIYFLDCLPPSAFMKKYLKNGAAANLDDPAYDSNCKVAFVFVINNLY